MSSNQQPQGEQEQRLKPEKKWFQKKRFIIPAALVLLVGIVSVSGGGDDSGETANTTQTEVESDVTESSEVETEAEEQETPSQSFSTSEQNAIDSAESYLRVSAFSKAGLIDQLEFEGYSNADATLAVNNIDVDWFEQAAKSAESYLIVSCFSRQGLIDQLLFEEFTQEEAEYGVDQSGLGSSGSSSSSGEGTSVSQQNAVESAESYLGVSAFSKAGLVEQLEFEGYSNADATYAVNNISVDWFEQAAKSAESYLNVSSFSRQGLIDQLLFEEFTREEAEYGVNAVGF